MHAVQLWFRVKIILLVDDDELLRESLGLALRRSGYCVIEADDGAAGFEMARRHHPDLILSDIDMPGGDGASLLRDIRSDSKLKSRQVVMMSGKPDLITPCKSMEEGADDFLAKPFSLEVLLGCMEARLSHASIGWRGEGQMAA